MPPNHTPLHLPSLLSLTFVSAAPPEDSLDGTAFTGDGSAAASSNDRDATGPSDGTADSATHDEASLLQPLGDDNGGSSSSSSTRRHQGPNLMNPFTKLIQARDAKLADQQLANSTTYSAFDI